MWINLTRLAFVFVSIFGTFTLGGVIYAWLQPTPITVTFDCRDPSQIDFPIEVRAKCNSLLMKAKNGSN